jgi:hypothetical protein
MDLPRGFFTLGAAQRETRPVVLQVLQTTCQLFGAPSVSLLGMKAKPAIAGWSTPQQ